MGKKNHSIRLDDIPDTSDEEIEPKELAVLNSILVMKKNAPEKWEKLKHVVYATMIFAVLSLPFTDRVFELAIPMASSWLILWGLKIMVFFAFLYLVSCVMK